jgi:hypothetical protein
MHLQRRARGSHDDAASAIAAPVPGKETQVQQIAAEGVSGAGSTLPFADQIASSFGPDHADTVHGIRAHTGGAASAASADIGAQAYATGNDVAFGSTPSLHTAAHEAAHVVQQRQGVHLKGGVGEEGDPYERHADAVADRVVSGLSAASLLGEGGAVTGAGGAVQKKGDKKADAKKEAQRISDQAPMVLYVMQDVLKGHKRLIEDYAPAQYKPAMWTLLGLYNSGGKGRAGREDFDRIEKELAPILAHAPGGEYEDVPGGMARLRTSVISSEARDRVDNTMLIQEDGQKKAVEIPDDRHPHEQGAVLQAQLPKLVAGLKATLERVHVVGEHVINEHTMGGKGEGALKGLEGAIHVLTIAEGFLKLTDEEFQHELTHIKGVMNGVGTYSELVKVVLEMSSASLGLTFQLGGVIAKLAGNEVVEHAMEHAGQAVGKTLGKVVAGVEIVHGLATLFDSSKSRDERIGGGIEIAAGVATLATGSSLGALPIMGPYMLLKAAAYLYSEAAIGWEVGTLKPVFEHMQQEAAGFARASEQIAIAGMLGVGEKDAERKAAMAAEEKRLITNLGTSLDSFLAECDDKGHGMEALDGWTSLNYYVGNHSILAEAFIIPVRHRGAKTPEAIAALTAETIKQIMWCFKHAPAIVKGSAIGKHAWDMDQMQDDMDAKEKKEKKD